MLIACTAKHVHVQYKQHNLRARFFMSHSVLLYSVAIVGYHCYTHHVTKNAHFLFCCSFYKYRPIFIIFGTRYTELNCNAAVVDFPTQLHTVATLPLENWN